MEAIKIYFFSSLLRITVLENFRVTELYIVLKLLDLTEMRFSLGFWIIFTGSIRMTCLVDYAAVCLQEKILYISDMQIPGTSLKYS